MTLSDDFLESACSNELQKAILDVLKRNDLTDIQKIEVLVKYIRDRESND